MRDKNGVIIILGSRNDKYGILARMGVERANEAIRQWQKHRKYKIICTGGMGLNFNITTEPHGKHVARYLVACGVSPESILKPVLSRYTLEDALLSKRMVGARRFKEMLVVTSEFHLKRAKHVFKTIYPKYKMRFFGAANGVTEGEYANLVISEREKLVQFKKQTKIQKL